MINGESSGNGLKVYVVVFVIYFFFFFNDTATTEIYTLSLHDALPICQVVSVSHQHIHSHLQNHRSIHHLPYPVYHKYIIGHGNYIPTMQFFNGISRNTQSKLHML